MNKYQNYFLRLQDATGEQPTVTSLADFLTAFKQSKSFQAYEQGASFQDSVAAFIQVELKSKLIDAEGKEINDLNNLIVATLDLLYN